MKKFKLVLSVLLLMSSQMSMASCNADPSDYGTRMGSPSGYKVFHVSGKHQCQSRENIGYWCNVETRDANDCTSGHARLRAQNFCCANYMGKQQTGYNSINYTPLACTPFL